MTADISHPGPNSRRSIVSISNAILDFKTGGVFGNNAHHRVIDDVSLQIAAGEIVALVGESGSGKTTLGKSILGLQALSSGQVETGASAADTNRVCDFQMVFQDPLSSFNPRFTIGSSISLALTIGGHVPESDIDAHISELMTRTGLRPEFRNRYPHEMSGGQLQRAAIARALAVSPKLIVADEAVSKLDVSVRAQILNLLKSLNRSERLAIVFITHDLGVARFLADRIVVMYFGRIVEVGPTEEIMLRPRHPYTATLVNARRKEGDVLVDAKPSDSGCNYSSRCNRATPQCQVERPGAITSDLGGEVSCFNPL